MAKRYMTIGVSILLVIWMMPLFAQQPPANPPAVENPPGKHDMKSMQGKQSIDGEIIAFLIAVDEHEVAAANDASQKKSESRVDEYAQMLKKDHSKHLEETQKLSSMLKIQPMETSTIEKLKTQSNTDLSKLSQLRGGDFDHAYINQMVKDHTNALKHIDNHYMKAVSETQLESHLKATHATISAHLLEAKRIQGSIKPSSK